MIKYIHYSMYDAFDNRDIQVAVNTINCMGAMGKGLALEFKIRYPEMNADYIEKFEKNDLKIGEPYLYKTPDKWILNFPTKIHWKYPSQIEYIESGLKFFVINYKSWNIKSIAFPRLGCTFGNLEWAQVKPVMEKHLNSLEDIDVYIYLDEQASDKENMILSILNDGNNDTIGQRFKLNDKQISSLKDHIKKSGKLHRIRELLEIEGIGPAAYQRVLARRDAPIIIQEEFGFS